MSNQIANFQKIIFESEKDETKYEKEILKKNKIRLKKIARWIKEEGEQKVILDLGCANGLVTRQFTKNNKVYGLDSAENFVQMARKNGLKAQHANLEEKFPFSDKKFDLIVANEIIEHIYNTDFFLSECNRVLKDKGKIILSVPNLRNPFSPWLLLFLNRPPVYSARYRSPHVRDFTYPIIKRALKNNGFQIIKKTGSNFYLPYLWRLANSRLSSLFGTIFPTWSKEIIIKAEKTKISQYNPEEIVISYKKGGL